MDSNKAMTWVCSIHLENKTIGDGVFSPEASKSLRELADAIDSGLVDSGPCAELISQGGTRMTIIGSYFLSEHESREVACFGREVLL